MSMEQVGNRKEGECLNCFHEENNPYDIFSIKDCTSNSKIIGDLPMEISQIIKFFTQRVPVVTVKVTEKHFRWSPLVQGGLEVPCENSVWMSSSIVNHTLLQRYDTLLREIYTEPKEEEVMGTFLCDPEANAITVFVQIRQKNNRKNQKPTTVRSRDIKQMLRAIE